MKKKKTFKLGAKQILPLVRGMGGCIASDRITVDGKVVGSMSREVPNNQTDSGWVFLSGDETQEYLDDPDHFGVYDVNTIANCDPGIIPLLFALPGQRFDREGGAFVESPDSLPDEASAGLPPGFRVVQRTVSIADGWSVDLPVPFRRRLEDGSHVLWRPGLTFWLNPVKDSGTIEDRLNELRGDIAVESSEVRSEERGGLTRLTYRLREDGAVAALYAFVLSRTGHLQIAAYFDREEDVVAARAVVESVMTH